ncbi:MAG: CBS domain-containing protein, partial [Planctomycetota bacterium]
MTPTWWIVLAVGTLVIASVFASLERSLRSASRSAMASLLIARRRVAATNGNGDEDGDDLTPEWTKQALDEPEPYVAALALPRVVLAGLSLAGWIMAARDLRGVASAGWIEVVLAVAAFGPTAWLLLAALPLAVAEHAAERTVLALGWLARLSRAVFAPLSAGQAFLSEIVRRLVGAEQVSEADEREAEILTLVEESEREGAIDESAREMIEAVVEFRTTTVEQIMTPRTEVEALEYTDDLVEVKKFAEDAGHSRLPVYEENLDHIVGVLYAKDLLKWLVSERAEREAFSLKEVLRPATFVPETKTVRELLAELLEQKVHIAFATDEYGGTAGIVTIEDIVEEVFGEIRDEYDREEHDDDRVQID